MLVQGGGVVGHRHGPLDVVPPGDLAAAVPGLLGRGFQPYRAFHRGDDGLADRVRDNPFEVLSADRPPVGATLASD